MASKQAVERVLARFFEQVTAPSTPPRLRAAMQHAVFAGGGRVRPRLVLEVARACGRGNPALAEAAGASIEFLHCASLVHDDLPCFDDASIRRGRPTVHVEFGEELAVLTGDALIVAAFQILGATPEREPGQLARMLGIMSGAVGAVRGIVAGQAWESEPVPDLRQYHRSKTAALFEAATSAGAVAGGGDEDAWRKVGALIGEAYQTADDIGDVVGDPASLGKPVGQDAMLERPSAVVEYGLHGARERMRALVEQTIDAIPPCRDREAFADFARALATRLAARRRPPLRWDPAESAAVGA